MNKTISNVIMAFLMFFLSMLFLRPVFARTIYCQVDNGKTYKIKVPKVSHGEYRETTKRSWSKVLKTLVIKDVNKFDESEDYFKATDGKYTVTYALRCVNE